MNGNRILKRLIRWAMISIDGDDLGDYPVQQVTYQGKAADATIWFPYGFHANVPDGQLALLLSIMGHGDSRVALPGSPTERPTLETNEVVVFHPPSGSKIHFKANGDIDITSTNDLNITTGDANITATGTVDITATGAATVSGSEIKISDAASQKLMNEATVTLFNAHTHAVTAAPGTTGIPNSLLVVDTHTTTKLKGD